MINWAKYKRAPSPCLMPWAVGERELPKHLSKKRFIKLMMFIGHSRNAAVTAAEAAVFLRAPFASAWAGEVGAAAGCIPEPKLPIPQGTLVFEIDGKNYAAMLF